MNPRSIRFRLTAWYAGLVAGVFVTLEVLTVWGLSHYLKSNLGEIQLRRARHIAQTLLVKEGQKDEARVASQIEALYGPVINHRFIRITRQDGSVLYVSGAPLDGSFDPLRVPALAPLPSLAEAREQKVAGFSPLMIGAWRFQPAGEPALLVEVGSSTASIEAMLTRLKWELSFGLVIVAAVMIGGGSRLLGRALGPVEQMARKAEQITQHSLAERLPVSGTGDELDRLSSSLNRMLDRLEGAVLNAKRFGAEAAHELRTPLTVLRGELEQVIQDRRLHRDLQGSLGKMLEELERLVSTVRKLFTLARLDLGEAKASWTEVDLAALAGSTVDHLILLAAEKKISLSCEASRPVLVEGDRIRLNQVVVNLLDNAIKFTPEGGTVKLRVCVVNNRALLEVADNGIGIEPEAVPRLFDRFTRPDPSQLHQGPRRAGLGLSIVRSICKAHGGEVRVESAPGNGACFRVELPLASAAGDSPAKSTLKED